LRYPLNPCKCIVEVREDSRLDLYALARGREPENVEVKGENCPPARALAKLVREALKTVQKTALLHMEHVHRAYKLKLESIPPRIEDRNLTAWTGQWVGLIEYRNTEKGCIQLLIKPKYHRFHEVYVEVVERVHSLSPALALAVADLHLGTHGNLPAVNAAIWLIEEYAMRNPPYIVKETPLEADYRVPRGVLQERRIRLNEKYYATLAAATLALFRIIASIRTHYKNPLLDSLLSSYAKLQQRLLTTLTSNNRIIEALGGYWLEEQDEDVLLEVKAAIRYAPGPGEARRAWLLLTPAPKIYEVYVLLKTVEAVEKKYRGETTYCRRQPIHCYRVKTLEKGNIRVYYNRPPKALSRLVYRLTGSRPHPDILLAYDGKRIVIDAKYRLAFTLTAEKLGSKLELAEALRLLGYITDLARNKHLQAILAVPDKSAKNNVIMKQLDGLAINIKLVEVSPRVGIKEILHVLP
jgi:hypothetical protein